MIIEGLNIIAVYGQVLPMAGNFIFVRLELLPCFLIKLNIKNQSRQLSGGPYSSSPEPRHSKITAADCSDVQPHYWQYQCWRFVTFFQFIHLNQINALSLEPVYSNLLFYTTNRIAIGDRSFPDGHEPIILPEKSKYQNILPFSYCTAPPNASRAIATKTFICVYHCKFT